MFENSYKVRISARAIIINQDKIVLNNFGNGEYYNFTGGTIEKNENLIEYHNTGKFLPIFFEQPYKDESAF